MTKQVNYVGKGTRNEQFSTIIDVAICVDDAEQFFFEYEGKRYLKVQVAERKEADRFGHTHTVSHFTPKAKLEPVAKPKRRVKK